MDVNVNNCVESENNEQPIESAVPIESVVGNENETETNDGTKELNEDMEQLNESFSDVNPFNKTPNNSNIPNITQPIPEDVRPELQYYNSSGDKYLIIFNQHQFKKTMYFNFKRPTTRMGTNADVLRMTSLFGLMGYKVTVHHDLGYDDIMKEVSSISGQDHQATSCLCFVILTHGDKGGYLYATDRPYQFTDITVRLENGHPSLVGKPKIFFVQACRGPSADDGRRLQYDGREASIVIPSHADFLVLYSSIEGFVSYRDREGSFLMQELCDVIEEYYKKYDILHVITLVQMRVAYHRSTFAPSNPHIHDKKQMPETRYSLTKLFKF